MTAKTLKIFSAIFAAMVFSGCTAKPVTQPVYIPAYKSCQVDMPECDNTKVTDTELLTEARLCIRRLKDALNACILE